VSVFDLDQFLSDCRGAVLETQPAAAIKEVVQRAVNTGGGVLSTLSGDHAGIFPIYLAQDLSVFNVVWAPVMRIPPHNHLMWATIGLYGGQEDNTFYRRAGPGLTASGGTKLRTGDVTLLGHNTIHAVTNPLSRFTGAIHVYGGNLATCVGRSEWNPATLEESPFDFSKTTQYFEEANRRMATDGTGNGASNANHAPTELS
jgi:predicted metal-dependent enzyme (double-stranded beta helix superfamily)